MKHYVCLSGQKLIELRYDAAEIFVVIHTCTNVISLLNGMVAICQIEP